ncbi:MAG TPA: MAPEG family protein [Rhodanobacter sp.]
MTMELSMLAWATILGLLQVALVATCSVVQRGLPWAVSPRDGAMPALTTIASRLDRARGNFLETFPFFVALVLANHVLQQHDSMTILGAQLYFWARVAYVPAYAAGIPYLRTLIWAVSIVGLVLLLVALL